MKKRLVIAAVTALCAISAFAGDDLSTLIKEYEHPVLGASAKAENLVVTLSDHAKLTLTSGSIAPLAAAGQPVGFFFSGTGTFDYVSTRRDEFPIATLEAKKTSSLKTTEANGKLAMTVPIDEVYLRAGAFALPQLPASGGAALDQAFAKHLEMMAARRTADEHVLVKQRLNAPSSPVIIATITTNGSPLSYVLDSYDAHTESVASLLHNRDIRARDIRDALWNAVISEQFIGGWNGRDFLRPQYLLTDIDYTLTATGENAKLSITETIAPQTAGQRAFQLNLRSGRHDSNGNLRALNVRSIKDAAGNAVAFDHAKDDLIVTLPNAAAENAAVKLSFEIDGDFLYNPGGDSFWELGTEPWFPQPDLNGQYYTIHSTIKIKKPWIAFAPGTTVRRVEEGDYNVVENRIDKPVQFAVALGGKYSFAEEARNGLTIRVATYAGNDTAAMKKLSNLAHKIVEFYQPWLGPFPFKEFNIIEIHSLGFGQAPPATMFITKEAFNPLFGADNQLFSKGVNHRFAHEIAHQYWGHVVKMPSSEEQWITESFAEYCSSFVVRELKGKDGYDAMVATWQANANDVKNFSSIALANRLYLPNDQMTAIRARTGLIYDKGALLLASLHKSLGDAKFLTFLRTTQGWFQWKFATTNDLIRVLQKVDPGTDYASLFERIYWGTEMPKM